MQQQSPTPVSPGLHRPGLDPSPVPPPALHLLGGVWIASCPTCGYQLITARTQATVERRARFRTCPICRLDQSSHGQEGRHVATPKEQQF